MSALGISDTLKNLAVEFEAVEARARENFQKALEYKVAAEKAEKKAADLEEKLRVQSSSWLGTSYGKLQELAVERANRVDDLERVNIRLQREIDKLRRAEEALMKVNHNYHEESLALDAKAIELAAKVAEHQAKIAKLESAPEQRISELETEIRGLRSAALFDKRVHKKEMDELREGNESLTGELGQLKRWSEQEIKNLIETDGHKDGLIAQLRRERDQAANSYERRIRTMKVQHEADIETLRGKLANVAAAIG